MEEAHIRSTYKERFDKVLVKIAQKIEEDIREYIDGQPHIDRISARSKSVERFVTKALKEENNIRKYSDPINQIQDQIGARVTCFYLKDVEVVNEAILKYYKPIEHKDMIPESESEFGYFGKHYVLHIPSDCRKPFLDEFGEHLVPKFFELQIKTLYQHAWSEASHDLAYKPDMALSSEQKRKVAFTAAQSWGADMIFEELRKQLSSN
jgi:putative GTP pyrophosphokinase